MLQRYEPEVTEALTQMFVSGISTHDIGKVLQTLSGLPGKIPEALSRSRPEFDGG